MQTASSRITPQLADTKRLRAAKNDTAVGKLAGNRYAYLHKPMHKPISKNPLITALSAEYAKQIKALKEEQESQLESLYREFTRKYQCLKQIIEALEDESSADRLHTSNADTSPHRPSC